MLTFMDNLFQECTPAVNPYLESKLPNCTLMIWEPEKLNWLQLLFFLSLFRFTRFWVRTPTKNAKLHERCRFRENAESFELF